MAQITLEEAQLHLPELIAKLQPGEEVQILSENRTVARLIAEAQPVRKPRKPGSAAGTLIILPEDEDYLEAFNDYMP
ncbi:antitoxin of toxin-antitoxin stability system [Pseudanabaenaceae cyanobacterium LEGE 13415]|nr:antitoxin of toxin-antitoxin stability system [Pseudanabaenaceae cyanobacterium LEGE 13415]